MNTHPYRATCPIGRKMSEPCPCQLDPSTSTPVKDPPQWVLDIEKITSWCNACLAEFEERAALIARDAGVTQPQAEAEATRQLRESVSAAEKRQGRLF